MVMASSEKTDKKKVTVPARQEIITKPDGKLISAFTCPICLGLFSKPKMLPCGHSFCEKCIKAVFEAEKFTCPECRADITSAGAGAGDAKRLKPNIALQFAVDTLEAEKQKRLYKRNELFGEACQHVPLFLDDLSANKCEHCNKKFCSTCLVVHIEKLRLETNFLATGLTELLNEAKIGAKESAEKSMTQIQEMMEAAKQEIITAHDCFLGSVKTLIEANRDRLLGDVDKLGRSLTSEVGNLLTVGINELPDKIAELKVQLGQINQMSMMHCRYDQMVRMCMSAVEFDDAITKLKTIQVAGSEKKFVATMPFNFFIEKKLSSFLNEETTIAVENTVTDEPKDYYSLFKNQHKEKMATDFHRLHQAAKNGDLEGMKRFFERPDMPPFCKPMLADHRDCSTSMWRTLLMQAVQSGSLDLVRYLVVEQGADIYDHAFWRKRLPIHYVTNLAVTKFLLDFDPNFMTAEDQGNDMVINKAAKRGLLDVVKFLVNEKGADIEHRGTNGKTPLFQAAHRGWLDVVKFLYKKGARLELFSGKGKLKDTALHAAAAGGWVEVAKFLLQIRPDFLEAKDGDGETPLNAAAGVEKCEMRRDESLEKRLLEMATFLIDEHGADIETRNEDGSSPLANASFYSPEMTELLMLKGADVNVTNIRGTKTVLHELIETTDNPKAIRVLLKHAPDLLEKETDDGYTALTLAVEMEQPKSAECLVREYGANVNHTGHGNCPIILRCTRDVGTLQVLLEAGADLWSRDNDGNTLLHLAATSDCHTKSAKMVAYLIEHEPEMLRSKNLDGKTPLEAARDANREDVVAILKKKQWLS